MCGFLRLTPITLANAVCGVRHVLRVLTPIPSKPPAIAYLVIFLLSNYFFLYRLVLCIKFCYILVLLSLF